MDEFDVIKVNDTGELEVHLEGWETEEIRSVFWDLAYQIGRCPWIMTAMREGAGKPIYISDEEWQARINGLEERAKIAASPNFYWSVESNSVQDVLFVFEEIARQLHLRQQA